MASALEGCRWDPGLLRPYFDKNNNRCVTINTGRRDPAGKPIFEKRTIVDLQNMGITSPVFNATSLRKEEWIELDKKVLRAARLRLRAWADLAAANTYGGFNGMSKMILEHEVQSDPGEAMVDMDGLTDGRNDAPLFQLRGLPLPITHCDFWFSARKLANSRNSGTPLDTNMAEAAGRRVAESIEKTLIGVDTGVTYGGASTQTGGYDLASTVFGYLNYTNRLTKTNLTTPTGSNASSTVNDLLAIRSQLYAQKFYGPFMVYHSDDWDQYLDNDYILTGGNVATQTLRNRLKSIENIMDVRRLDFLRATATAATDPAQITSGKTHAFTLIVVQMTSEVAEAVNGMDITTVQWESVGGMRLNFKVMCIQVPRLRSDYYNQCGLLQGTTS